MLLQVLLVIAAGPAIRADATCEPRYHKFEELPEYFFRPTTNKKLEHGPGYYQIETQGTYIYFNVAHKEILINTFGSIQFPVEDRLNDVIVGFLGFNSIQNCGDIYWRETTKLKPIRQFRKVIEDSFDDEDFEPTHILTVTFYNVDSEFTPCCQEPGGAPTTEHGLNTYQIVLGTDGTRTFALLNYGTLGWEQGIPASLAGFRNNLVELWYNYELSPLTLVNNGNPRPGQYAFRVDQDTIGDPRPDMTHFAENGNL